MGIASHMDTASFATSNYVFESNLNKISRELFMLAEPESFCGNKNVEFENCNARGWTLLRNWRAGEWKCGTEKKINAPGWKKNEHCVWIVNESPYESVGHFQVTIVAKDSKSIEVFLEDFSSLLELRTKVKIVQNKPIVHYY